MDKSGMKRRAIGMLKFLGMSAVLLMALAVLNWMPTSVQKSSVHTFASIEEAGSQLGIEGLIVPAYFPEHLAWPPTEVVGQRKPHEAVVFIIEDKATRRPALIVSQSASQEFDAAGRADVESPSEVTSIPIKGRSASLKAGSCGAVKCSSISWHEPAAGSGGLYIRVLLNDSTSMELVRIAESMAH